MKSCAQSISVLLLLLFGKQAWSTTTRQASSVAKASAPAAPTTIIPPTSFDSQADFDASWNYNYPWGTDHNGAARMDKSQAVLSEGSTLTLTAKRVDGQKPARHGGKDIAIHYLSGTVHARSHIAVATDQTVELAGLFRAPVARGTWPAFWLTYVDGWPPEVDLAEWKGSDKISFNTFNTSQQVAARDVGCPRPNAFHQIRVVMAGGMRDVTVRFYMDEDAGAANDGLVTTQVGRGFVEKGMYL